MLGLRVLRRGQLRRRAHARRQGPHPARPTPRSGAPPRSSTSCSPGSSARSWPSSSPSSPLLGRRVHLRRLGAAAARDPALAHRRARRGDPPRCATTSSPGCAGSGRHPTLRAMTFVGTTTSFAMGRCSASSCPSPTRPRHPPGRPAARRRVRGLQPRRPRRGARPPLDQALQPRPDHPRRGQRRCPCSSSSSRAGTTSGSRWPVRVPLRRRRPRGGHQHHQLPPGGDARGHAGPRQHHRPDALLGARRPVGALLGGVVADALRPAAGMYVGAIVLGWASRRRGSSSLRRVPARRPAAAVAL